MSISGSFSDGHALTDPLAGSIKLTKERENSRQERKNKKIGAAETTLRSSSSEEILPKKLCHHEVKKLEKPSSIKAKTDEFLSDAEGEKKDEKRSKRDSLVARTQKELHSFIIAARPVDKKPSLIIDSPAGVGYEKALKIIKKDETEKSTKSFSKKAAIKEDFCQDLPKEVHLPELLIGDEVASLEEPDSFSTPEGLELYGVSEDLGNEEERPGLLIVGDDDSDLTRVHRFHRKEGSPVSNNAFTGSAQDDLVYRELQSHSEIEIHKEDLLPVKTRDSQDLGKVTKEEINVIRSVAGFVLGKLGTEFRDLEKTTALFYDSEGEIRKFAFIPSEDSKIFVVAKGYLISFGAFKFVYPVVREDRLTSVIALPRNSDGFDSYSRMKAAKYGQAEALDGEQVVERMLSLRGLPNVIAPHLAITEKKSVLHGGLLFPCMDKGTYSSVFASEIQPSIVTNIAAFKRAMRLLYDIASGVENIQKAGYMHGDLKPLNFMIRTTETGEEEGGVTDIDGVSLPRFNMWMRTDYYLSPQNKIGTELDEDPEKNYDWNKDDVWSFGLSCFELITGQKFYSCFDKPVSIDFLGSYLYEDEDMKEFQARIDQVIDKHVSGDMTESESVRKMLKNAICMDGTKRADISSIKARLYDLKR